jgi:hypothetical protein
VKIERWKMALRWRKELIEAFAQIVKGEKKVKVEEPDGDKNRSFFGYFNYCNKACPIVDSSFNVRAVEEARDRFAVSLEGIRRFRELLLAVRPSIRFYLDVNESYETDSYVTTYDSLFVAVKFTIFKNLREKLELPVGEQEWEGEEAFKELLKFLNRLEETFERLLRQAEERIEWLNEPISSFEELNGRPKKVEERRAPKVALVGGGK